MLQNSYSKLEVYGSNDVVTSVEDAKKQRASSKAMMALMVPAAVALGAILLASYFQARTPRADSTALIATKPHAREHDAMNPKIPMQVPADEAHSGSFAGTGDGSAGSWREP
jgi:hypothetical protein